MPNNVPAITAFAVRQLKEDGRYCLGGVPGFYLRIKNGSPTYILRYVLQSRRREFALGARDEISLSQARQRAMECRLLISRNIDPHVVRQIKGNFFQSDAVSEILTNPEEIRKATDHKFREVALHWLKDCQLNGYWENNVRGADTVEGILNRHVFPVIGEIGINSITPEHVRNALAGLWQQKPTTGRKTATYIKKIIAWAIAMRVRQAQDNPADMNGALGTLMEPYKRSAVPSENHAALDFSEIPQFCAVLNKRPDTSSKMLLLSILTASRSKAIRFATWDEFDLEKGTWTIPSEHDKVKEANRDRTIMLSSAAVALLKEIQCQGRSSGLVFSNTKGKPFTDMTCTAMIRRLHEAKFKSDGIGWIDKTKSQLKGEPCVITAHGTSRSSFRTWAKDDVLGNNRRFDQEAVELCLLHSKNDVYNGAYDRARLLTERRVVMEEWGKYCSSLFEKEADKEL